MPGHAGGVLGGVPGGRQMGWHSYWTTISVYLSKCKGLIGVVVGRIGCPKCPHSHPLNCDYVNYYICDKKDSADIIKITDIKIDIILDPLCPPPVAQPPGLSCPSVTHVAQW